MDLDILSADLPRTSQFEPIGSPPRNVEVMRRISDPWILP